MSYGIARLLADLAEQGYTAEAAKDSDGFEYAVIPAYEINLGQFVGKVIGLGIPAPPDYPRAVGSSIHIRAAPQLYEIQRIEGVRNVTTSKLGDDWRYWSHSFGWTGERSTRTLLSQINRIFQDA
jgi:hypothetical protein